MPTDSQPTESMLGQTLKDAKGSAALSAGAGLKPASVGGGGPGVPALSLQRSLGSGAASGLTVAPGGAGSGRGIPVPAAYAALNGGAGMGMPMGGAPGSQRQAAGKGKRGPQEDQALYTEDRAWTEGVIGRRRA